MDRFRNLIPLVLVVLLGVAVQVVLVAAQTKDAPAEAAVEFTEAFYKLSPRVTDRMCGDLLEDEGDVDDLYYKAVAKARERGFSASYPKMQLFNVHTVVLAQDATSAQVELSCTMKRAIHPAFAYFLKMWNMGETYHLDDVLDMVKEDGQWKVCKYDFALID